jgi:hypothetical protein
VIARIALALAALTIAGCAGRLSHFHTLSQAGVAYTRASRTVLQDAGTEAIDADSVILLRTRSGLTEAQRAETLRTNNELLRTRLKILADIQRHSMLPTWSMRKTPSLRPMQPRLSPHR